MKHLMPLGVTWKKREAYLSSNPTSELLSFQACLNRDEGVEANECVFRSTSTQIETAALDLDGLNEGCLLASADVNPVVLYTRPTSLNDRAARQRSQIPGFNLWGAGSRPSMTTYLSV